MKIVFNSLLTMASLLALTACAGGKAQPANPAPIPPSILDVPDTTRLNAGKPVPTDQEAGVYARLSRLEADVSGIKTQMTQVGPILEKMPALQDKLGELVAELQRIDARVAAAQVHVNALPEPAVMAKPVSAAKPVVEPQVKPTPAKPTSVSTSADAPMPAQKPKIIPEKAAPKLAPVSEPVQSSISVDTEKSTSVPLSASSSSAPATLKEVRIGDYPDKTRIVLDVTRKVPFTYDLDNSEKILIIDLDTPEFAAAAGMSFAKSPLVASYTAQAVTDGKSRLILQLRDAVDVAKTQALPPNGDKGDRIVIDLVKAKS